MSPMLLPRFSTWSRRRPREVLFGTLLALLTSHPAAAVEGGRPHNRHVVIQTLVCEEQICQPASLLVWDGDSFTVRTRNGQREKIRIQNIDAPEIDGHCEAEQTAAIRAKDELVRLLSADKVDLRRGGRDRYERRLAFVRAAGRDVGEVLIEKRFVRAWEGRRRPWC